MFCCHDDNRPDCTSIRGTPKILLVCTVPLKISTLSGVIFMFTSLSLSFCKIFSIFSLSFFSTAIITSSILFAVIIGAIFSVLPKLVIAAGSSLPGFPFVLIKPDTRYPGFSLLLTMVLYNDAAFLLEPIISVLKNTRPFSNCFFAAVKKNKRIIKVTATCMPHNEKNSL